MFRIKCDATKHEDIVSGQMNERASKRARAHIHARSFVVFFPLCCCCCCCCCHFPHHRIDCIQIFPFLVLFNGKLLAFNVSHVSHEYKRAARLALAYQWKSARRGAHVDTRSNVYVYQWVWFWWLCQWMFGGAHSKCTKNRDVIF